MPRAPVGGKGKAPKVYPAKPKIDLKDVICFFCNQTGHYKRDCKKHQDELKKNGGTSSSSGIYYIEVNMSTTSGWVLDTGSQSHICVDVQALESRRDLTKGEADIRVADGTRVVATAVGVVHLSLPSGLILTLNNFYCVPSFRKDIISI